MDITRIPDVMTAQGWPEGAALMRKWFAGPARVKPAFEPADTGTVGMDWVLGFPRARAVYDAMIAGRVWANPAARGLIADRIRSGALRPGTVRAASGPAAQGVRTYVNSRTAGAQTDPLDGLSAALGRFNFHLVIDGAIERVDTRLPAGIAGPRVPSLLFPGHLSALGAGRPAVTYLVTVTAVGVYVYDSYDFNDEPTQLLDPTTWASQPLGCWNPTTNAAARSRVGAGWDGFCVSNSDFAAWRAANGRGGDFLVFSDVKRTQLVTPDTFPVNL